MTGHAPRDHTADLALAGVALAVAGIELFTYAVEPWELFHDELYYRANALRPGLGYVDHPPLAPWILAVSLALFGDGALGFAAVPAACAAGTVFLSGRIARSLGAGRFGQLLAALAVAVVPVHLIFFSFFSVNAIELLLWAAATWVLVELVRTGEERLWLAFGLLGGIALLAKHTFLLFALGIAVGVVATPLRRQLASRWLWLGALVAGLLALPNLYWNAVNGWPSLEFYSNRGVGILDATLAEIAELHVVAMNPVNLLVWLPGLAFLLFAKRARPYRALGIAFLVLLAVIAYAGQRRIDRIAGAYPIALAAGAVAWDLWRPRFFVALRGALVVLLLASGVAIAPGILPLLSPAGVEAYYEAIGEEPDVEIGDVGSRMPLFLTGRLEWERFGGEVLDAWRSLPPDERERSVLLTPHWLFAAVLEYYGRDREMPPVVSPHNAYYFWRSEAAGRDVAVSVGIPGEVLSRHFAETRELALFRCAHCAVFRPDLPIRVSVAPLRPLDELLAEWRHFGILPAPKLQIEGPRPWELAEP